MKSKETQFWATVSKGRKMVYEDMEDRKERRRKLQYAREDAKGARDAKRVAKMQAKLDKLLSKVAQVHPTPPL